ncbi:MAG: site-specific DNA-methyltransferase [Phycisphaerales bacterium]
MAHGMAYRWHPIHCWQLPKKHDGPCWDVVHHNTECGNAWNHPCTKPLSLMLSIVGFAPPDSTVLDPFCGSGTTGVAAIRLGRKFIGIEKNHDYAQIARDRLAAEEEGSTLQARRAGQLSLLAGVK